MRRITAVLSSAAVVLMAAGLLAQANFSGKWSRDMTASPMAAPGGGGGGRGGGGGGGLGTDLTITQDAKTFTIEYMGAGQTPMPVKLVYNLDGSPSKNTVTTGRGAQDQTAKATMAGGKLTVVTTTDFNGTPIESTRVFSMEGANLSVEQTAAGRGGGAPTTTKVIYNKK